MSSKMLESKVGYSTRKICKDLLDLIGHSSQPDEIYGKVPFVCKILRQVITQVTETLL